MNEQEDCTVAVPEGWPEGMTLVPCWEPGYEPTEEDFEALRQLAWAIHRKHLTRKKGLNA